MLTRRALMFVIALFGFGASAKAARAEPRTFSFCVGRPWPRNWSNPDGTSICTYAYGTDVKHGTMADAEAFRQYVNEQTDEEN